MPAEKPPRQNELAKILAHLKFFLQERKSKGVSMIALVPLAGHKVRADFYLVSPQQVRAFSENVPDPSDEASWGKARQTLKSLLGIEHSLMPPWDDEARLAVQVILDPKVQAMYN